MPPTVATSRAGQSPVMTAVCCSVCGTTLSSKTQLFKHLTDQHGWVNPQAKPVKATLLVGWLASQGQVDKDEWARDTSHGTAEDNFDSMLTSTNPTRARVETHIYAALHVLGEPECTMEAALAMPIASFNG